MALKTGDIIDERKNHEQSCGIVAKILSGGAGFEKLVCCGNKLGEGDVVSSYSDSGRMEGEIIKKGAIIDEKKNHTDSCGFRVKVLGGGAGFKEIVCCGNVLTEQDVI
ncbi:MAG: hypothetical protein ACE5G7_04645 [Candidatus Hydrothermarchaeaceae archaeon]